MFWWCMILHELYWERSKEVIANKVLFYELGMTGCINDSSYEYIWSVDKS